MNRPHHKCAYRQLQTYKSQIPALFTYNEALVVSDLTVARHDKLTSDWSRFAPWRAVGWGGDAPSSLSELEALVRGMFAPATFGVAIGRWRHSAASHRAPPSALRPSHWYFLAIGY